jgi:NTP pyrophosphatase (non-canonical NTP hydrolase)
MKTEDKLAIANKAISHYGEDAQLEQAVEELAELTLACQKFKRVMSNPDSTQRQAVKVTNDMIDEIADVKIVVNQLSLIFGVINVEKRETFKYNRLKKRINEEIEINGNPNQVAMFD